MKSFKLLSGRVALGTEQAGWYDLFTTSDLKLLPGVVCMAPTGVTSEMSPGLRAKIEEKSGVGLQGISVRSGCIDSDYRKEWFVLLQMMPVPMQPSLFDTDVVHKKQRMHLDNVREKGFSEIVAGTAIAAFKIEEIPTIAFECGPQATLIVGDQVRTDGFGSTDYHLRYKAICELLNGGELLSTNINLKHLCGTHNFEFTFSGINVVGRLDYVCKQYGTVKITKVGKLLAN